MTKRKIPRNIFEGLGFCSKVKVKVELKENIIPVFRPKKLLTKNWSD